jgi:hypothetical protein
MAWRWLGYPWWGPAAAMGDAWDDTFAFPGAPYEDGFDGYVRMGSTAPTLRNDDLAPRDAAGGRLIGGSGAVRAIGEGSWIDAGLQRGTVSLLWSGNHRFEAGTDWSFYRERLPEGGTDALTLGHFNATILFALGPRALFRTGVGPTLLIDRAGSVPGGHFLYGFDVFPVRPLVISGKFLAGWIGEAGEVQARATVGAVFGAIEAYAGYEAARIGDVRLSGPVLGVRVWR